MPDIGRRAPAQDRAPAGNVLEPSIKGHTVGVSPLTDFMGILVGSIFYSMPGAFPAVPVAGAVQGVIRHTLELEDPDQAEAHSSPIVQQDAREAAVARAAVSLVSDPLAAPSTLDPQGDPHVRRQANAEGQQR